MKRMNIFLNINDYNQEEVTSENNLETSANDDKELDTETSAIDDDELETEPQSEEGNDTNLGIEESLTEELPELTKKRKKNSNQYRKKEEEPTECELCNVKFTTKRSYQRHYKSIHELKDIIDCDECGKQLKGSLLQHKNAVHRKKKIYCPHCNKIFSKGSERCLRRHISKVHWYHCDSCKLSFENSHEFDSHIQTEHIAKYC